MKITSLGIALVAAIGLCANAYATQTVSAIGYGPYDAAYTNAMNNLKAKYPEATYSHTSCSRFYTIYRCWSYGTIN